MMNFRPRPTAWLPTIVVALIPVLFASCSRQSGKAGAVARADAHFAAGDYDKAEIEYKNALGQPATDGHVFGRMGAIYFEQGRLPRASVFLRRALELRPDDADTRAKVALFDFGAGKAADARSSVIRILEANPGHTEALVLLAETANTPELLADSKARIARLPAQIAGSAPALTALAITDLRERKLDDAEAKLTRARAADPKFFIAQSVLGQILLARNDTAAAEKAFAAAAELAPARSQNRVQLARFLIANGRVDEGRRILQECIERTPDFLPPYLALAAQADAEKKHAEAASLLERVIARDGENPEAMLMLGNVRVALGDRERGIAVLERAASLFPKAAQIHFQLAQAHLASNNLAAANASLLEALQREPNFLPAILVLARLQLRQNEFASAAKTLSAVTPPRNSHPEVRVLLATALRGQGAFDEARKIVKQLADETPASPEYRFLEASLLVQLRRVDEARRMFAEIHERSPDYLPAIDALCSVDAAEKKFPEAVARIEAFIKRNPASAQAYFILAGIHRLQPDPAKAEAALQKTLELQPDNAAAFGLLTKLHLDTNQIEKAIPRLLAALEKNPKDVTSAYVLGTLHETKRDFPAARDAYEKAIAATPKGGDAQSNLAYSQALNNLAYIYTEHLVDLEKAQDAAQRARDALPSQPEVADSLGWVLYKRGQFSRALPLFEEAAEKLPDNPDIQYHLGLAAYMSGQEANARRALERALKLKPDFSGANEARSTLDILAIDPAAGDASRAQLEKAVADRPGDPVANLRLGAVLERAGSADKALAAYAVALKTNPSLVPAVLGTLRIHAARNELPRAIAFGREARKTLSTDGLLAGALGRLTYLSGDFSGALNLLRDAARREPDHAEIQLDLADAAYAMGLVPLAETALNDALRAAPNSARAPKARQFLELITLAQPGSDAAAGAKAADAALAADANSLPAAMLKALLVERAGNAADASKSYDQILARFPDFIPAKRRLTIIYGAMAEPPKNAAEIAGKAREASAGDAEIARAFGLILFRQGNFSRAASLLQESARTLGSDAELMYYLGRAQHENKDAAAAKRSLQRAVDLGLKGDLASEAKRLLAASEKSEKK